MPDKRMHRGPHPSDPALFAETELPRLRQAASDYRWLLSRGYASDAALKLVGDHFQLVRRQRMAVARSSCSEETRQERVRRRVRIAELAGRQLAVDGFNCLITVETALSSGVVLVGAEGAHRDLASVHGTYRRVIETRTALDCLIELVCEAAPASATWYLDSPVSNSGKLASMMREAFEAAGLDWRVELVNNADREIAATGGVAASSDSWLLDSAPAWVDLAGAVVECRVPGAWVVDFVVD